MKRFLFCIWVSALPLWADGHGPAFGFSTATLGAGDTSVGTAYMWRAGTSMIGPIVSYGVTGDFQISVSSPIHVTHGDHPVGRFSATMPGDPELEALAAWRFHHALTGVGTRNESTLYFGTSVTTQTPPLLDGPPLRRSPSFYIGAATGHVSRRFYVWAGAGYEKHARWSEDHQSDSLLSSLVLGWRPAFLDKDYPKPDFRIFWETTGEYVGKASRDVLTAAPVDPSSEHNHGPTTPLPPPDVNGVVVLPDSGGKALYSGPTFLVTYKDVAVQGGALREIWRDVNGIQPQQRYRAVVSFTYYFLGGRKK